MPTPTPVRAEDSSPARVKPRWRGVSHLWAAFVAVAAGAWMHREATNPAAARVALVYAASLVLLFAASAAYHVPHWSPAARARLRRVDHAGIFVFIAGTCTPFCRMLPGGAGDRLLAVVWGGAAVGIVQALFWAHAPKAFRSAIYLALGWVPAAYLPEFGRVAGDGPVALIVAGGAAYSVGAVVYARRRPDPWPAQFGYHEIFHALVVLAAVLHGAAVRSVLHLIV